MQDMVHATNTYVYVYYTTNDLNIASIKDSILLIWIVNFFAMYRLLRNQQQCLAATPRASTSYIDGTTHYKNDNLD